MGLWSTWYEKNAGKEGSLVNAEWVLKKIDEGSSENAPKNVTLNDAAESSVLPATASAPIVTLLQTIRNNLKYLFNNTYTKTEIINKIYPVGSIYISVNNTNPGTYLTGTTWATWGSGRVPVGVDTGQAEFNTVEKTGGEKTHTLTVNEMPSHNHEITDPGHSHTLNGNNYDHDGNAVLWTDSVDMGRSGGVNTSTTNISINNTGGNNSHNNIQPYITCYMFKRIS
jgi:hypothetical protein